VKPTLRGPHIKWTPSIKWTQLQLGTLMTLNVKNQSIALAPILTSAFCYSQERANHTSDFLKIFNSGWILLILDYNTQNTCQISITQDRISSDSILICILFLA